MMNDYFINPVPGMETIVVKMSTGRKWKSNGNSHSWEIVFNAYCSYVYATCHDQGQHCVVKLVRVDSFFQFCKMLPTTG